MTDYDAMAEQMFGKPAAAGAMQYLLETNDPERARSVLDRRKLWAARAVILLALYESDLLYGGGMRGGMLAPEEFDANVAAFAPGRKKPAGILGLESSKAQTDAKS